jgi:hypothetical protein
MRRGVPLAILASAALSLAFAAIAQGDNAEEAGSLSSRSLWISTGTRRQNFAHVKPAPTLAAILQVQAPSGNIGHILTEVAFPSSTTANSTHAHAKVASGSN